jgi:hypothetical protein
LIRIRIPDLNQCYEANNYPAHDHASEAAYHASSRCNHLGHNSFCGTFCHLTSVYAMFPPSPQAASSVRVIPRPGSRICADAAYRNHLQLFRQLRRVTARRNSTVLKTTVVPVSGIVLGLAASAAWAAFLGFELFRAIEHMF